MAERTSTILPGLAPNKQAIILTRVSSDKQEDNYSLDSQEEGCRAYATGQGFAVGAVFTEVYSGADELEDRPVMREVLAAIRSQRFAAVVIYRINRATRAGGFYALSLAYACERAGVELHFVTGNPAGKIDISGPNGMVGRLMLLLGGDQAAEERTTLQEALQRGRRSRAAVGLPLPGGLHKYGYRLVDGTDPTTGKLIPKARAEVVPSEAAVVRRIFAAAVAGTPIRRIAHDLANDGVPNAHGATTWSMSTIRAMLNDSRYAGRAYAYRWGCTRPAHKRYKQTLREEAEQVLLPEGTYPALVSEAVFAAVQHRLAESKRLSARANPHPNRTLVRGFVFCGVCGDRLRVVNLDPEHGNGARYRCIPSTPSRKRHQAAQAAGALASTPAIHAHEADYEAWAAITKVCTDPDLVAHQLRKLESSDGDGALAEEIARAQAVLDDIVARERRFLRLQADAADAHQEAEIGVLLKTYAHSRQQAEADLAKLQGRAATRAAALARIDDAKALLERLGAHLDHATWDEKRELVSLLISWVKVWPAGSEVRIAVKVRIPDPTSPLAAVVVATLDANHDLATAPAAMTESVLADPAGIRPPVVATQGVPNALDMLFENTTTLR